jgi:hypothetical protein
MATVEEILDTEIPRPTWTLRPGYDKPLPSEATFNRGSPRRTLNQNGRWEEVPAGEPRIYGPEQALLLNNQAVTNLLDWSSDFSNWATDGASVDDNTLTSIIAGENAARVSANNASYADKIYKGVDANLSSSLESAFAILEEGSSQKVRFNGRENNNYNDLFGLTYNWSNDTLSGQGNEAYVDSKRLAENGPNGNPLVILFVRYDPTDIGGANYSGDPYEVSLWPDRNDNNEDVICHHAQVAHQRSISEPVVCSGSTTTVNGETLYGPAWDTLNSNRATFFFEAAMLRRKGGTQYDYARFFQPRNGNNGRMGVERTSLSFRGGGVRLNPGVKWEPFEFIRCAASIDEDGRGNTAHLVARGADGVQEEIIDTTNGEFLSDFAPNGWKFESGNWAIKEITYAPDYTPISELRKVI